MRHLSLVSVLFVEFVSLDWSSEIRNRVRNFYSIIFSRLVNGYEKTLQTCKHASERTKGLLSCLNRRSLLSILRAIDSLSSELAKELAYWLISMWLEEGKIPFFGGCDAIAGTEIGRWKLIYRCSRPSNPFHRFIICMPRWIHLRYIIPAI